MSRRAFTLLELLIVVVLLGVLATLSWPAFNQAGRSEELDESARRIKTLTQMCRAQAMNEARRYRLAVRRDGTLRVTRQRDPILAPHQYFRFRDPWADMPFLLEHVWIESVLPLPEGPPPILVEDELLEFEDFEDREPIPVTELEQEVELGFEPDGTSGSALWLLRDEDGRGIEMMLDGRLGRIRIELIERLDSDTLDRPERIEGRDEEIEYEEDQGELEERR